MKKTRRKFTMESGNTLEMSVSHEGRFGSGVDA